MEMSSRLPPPNELKQQYKVPTIEDVFLKAEKEELGHENTGNL